MRSLYRPVLPTWHLLLNQRSVYVDNDWGDRDHGLMPETPAQKSAISFLRKYWMATFILASMLYVGYYINSQITTIDDDIRFSPLPLIGCVVFQLLFWLVSSHLWSTALLTVSKVQVGLLDSFFQLCLVNLGKYLPGKIWGMIARGSYLNQRHAIDLPRIVQATYIEQIYLIGSGIILASLVLAVITANQLMWLLAVLILAIISAAMIYQKPLDMLLKLSHRLRGAQDGFASDKFTLSILKQLYLLTMYMMVWVLLSMVLFGLYIAVFQVPPTLPMAAVMVLACVVGVSAGFVAIFSPGGVGVREAVMGSILAAYIPVSDAVLLVLLFRIWLATLEVIVGGPLYLSKRKEIQRTASSIAE